jgi:hypothetical protein
LALGGAAAACAAAAVVAATSSSPLSVRIVNVYATGADNIGQAITVDVTNHSSSAASPAFTLETASGVSSFWHVAAGGPRSLAPGASATYTLLSPDSASQFSSDNGLTVLAFLSKPASVSVSNRYQPALWHVGFDPESIDRLVPVGQPVVIHAQLLNEWDTPIDRAGVPITVTQSVFNVAQSAFGSGRLASINGRPAGREAIALTNAHGIANFTVVGVATSFYELTLLPTVPSYGLLGYDTEPSQPIQLRFVKR